MKYQTLFYLFQGFDIMGLASGVSLFFVPYSYDFE